MAVTLNANTSTGFIVTPDTSGVLQLQTGGTTAVTVDASQQVGIGTASPNSKLEVTSRITASDGGGASRIALNIESNTSAQTYSAINSYNYGTSTARNLVLNESGGNVGIGTISPEAPLHVAKSASGGDGGYLYLDNPAASTLNNKAGIRFATSSGGSFASLPTGEITNLLTDGSTGASALTFGTFNGSASGERMRIDSSGNLLVGAIAKPTTNFYGLYVKSSTTSSADWGFYVDNSAGTSIIRARNDGYVNLLSTYSNTTASAANMFVDSTGYVYRSTSSIKYKTDVQNATHGLVDLLKLRSVTYKQKTENAENNVPSAVFGGLIAEEVHEAGLTEFVQYAEDGSPDALAYGNMVSLCIKAIQELKALVDTQASTITSLTDRITALEGTTP